MTEREKKFLDYLEYCYIGARAMDDIRFMVRIARAIAGFRLDPDIQRNESSTVTYTDWMQMVGAPMQCELEILRDQNTKLRDELHKVQLACERKNKLLKTLEMEGCVRDA